MPRLLRAKVTTCSSRDMCVAAKGHVRMAPCMTADFTPFHKLSAVLLLFYPSIKLVDFHFLFHGSFFSVKACGHDGSSIIIAAVDDANKLLPCTFFIYRGLANDEYSRTNIVHI